MTSEAQGTRPGDVIVIEGNRVGAGRRVGEVVEVLGEAKHTHYKVRWDDGHESLFYPEAGQATIKHHERRSRKPAAAATPQPDDEPVLTHEP